jgi:hypothetical protein
MALGTLPSAAGEMDVPLSCGRLCKPILRSHSPPHIPTIPVFRSSSSAKSYLLRFHLLRLRRRLGLDWARGGERFIGVASAYGNSRVDTCQPLPLRLNRSSQTRRPRPRVQPTAPPQCRCAPRLPRHVFPLQPL